MYELTSKIIEILLQLILVIFAGLALSAWKKEIRGKEKYKLAKDLLEYLKDIRFIIHSKEGAFYQIYLNDILADKKRFYKDQIIFIGGEKLYFDESIFGLFHHLNIRSDVFLPRRLNSILQELYPSSGKRISSNLNEYTYIRLDGIEVSKAVNFGENNDKGIYLISSKKDLTIEEYFKKWQKLIMELNKMI